MGLFRSKQATYAEATIAADSELGLVARYLADMAWAYLILAGLFEIGWASSINFSDGFTRLWPTLIFFVCLASSLLLLGRAASFRSARLTRYGPESARRGLSRSASWFIRSRPRRSGCSALPPLSPRSSD